MRGPSAASAISVECWGLGCKAFARVQRYLARQSIEASRGTIVDATIVSAPCSTKDRKKSRDPEMRQTRKGKQWGFGAEAAPRSPTRWRRAQRT